MEIEPEVPSSSNLCANIHSLWKSPAIMVNGHHQGQNHFPGLRRKDALEGQCHRFSYGNPQRWPRVLDQVGWGEGQLPQQSLVIPALTQEDSRSPASMVCSPLSAVQEPLGMLMLKLKVFKWPWCLGSHPKERDKQVHLSFSLQRTGRRLADETEF